MSAAFPLAAAGTRLRGKPGRPRTTNKPVRAPADQAIVGRLLELPAAAAYLGLSAWTIRDLDAAGVLRRVRIPLPNGGEVRRVLFDRQDLDELIARWKDPGR